MALCCEIVNVAIIRNCGVCVECWDPERKQRLYEVHQVSRTKMMKLQGLGLV